MKLMQRWVERFAWALGGAIIGSGVAASAQPPPDTLYRKLEVLAEVLGHIENYYVDAVSPSEIIYGAAKGAVAGLDPHSTFFAPQEYQSLVNATEGEYAGIGIELEMRGELPEIVSVLDNSPAHKSGLQPGDRLISIDERP